MQIQEKQKDLRSFDLRLNLLDIREERMVERELALMTTGGLMGWTGFDMTARAGIPGHSVLGIG